MDTLYDRITALCKNKGVSGSRMCLDLGLSKSTMSDLKYGRTKGMSTATATKIASYLDVTVGYLLGEEEKENPTVQDDGVTENQRILIEVAKTLSEDQAALALRLLKSLTEVD